MKLMVKRGARYVPAPAHMVRDAAAEIERMSLNGTRRDFSRPREISPYLTAILGAREYEVFCVAYLDGQYKLIEFQELFRGTVDGASAHPREVVREAIARNASAVIFAHNHPSGSPDASQADELVTRRLKEALALIDVRVLDHFIVARDRVASFAERGLI